MLLAGWEVRIVKSCDRGLENAVAYKWVCLRKLNWLTCRLQTIVKNLTSERVNPDTTQRADLFRTTLC